MVPGPRRWLPLAGLLALALTVGAASLPAAIVDPVWVDSREVRCPCDTGLSSVRIWPEGDEAQAVTLAAGSDDLQWLTWRMPISALSWQCNGSDRPETVSLPRPVDYWSVQLVSREPCLLCRSKSGLLKLSVWSRGDYNTSVVYMDGEGGYACTAKIPVLLRTARGTLLAMAEARRGTCSDAASTDLVVKRSEDGGITWSPLQPIRTGALSGPGSVVGNAAPVQLEVSSRHYPGRILLPHCVDNEQVWIMHSDDDGRTWSAPRLIENVTQPDWRWVGTGPPGSLQLQRGSAAGRVLVPAYHGHLRVGILNNIVHGHVMLSDDGGDTWRLSGTSGYCRWAPGDLNENQAVELKNGSVLLNGRSLSTLTTQKRLQVRSDDGGETWGPTQFVDLPQPVNGCEGSVASAPLADPPVLLYSGPDSFTLRQRMQLWMSRDEGSTWQRFGQPVDTGFSGYSSLQVDCDGGNSSHCDALLLYETSDMAHSVPVQAPLRQIFRRLPLSLPTDDFWAEGEAALMI